MKWEKGNVLQGSTGSIVVYTGKKKGFTSQIFKGLDLSTGLYEKLWTINKFHKVADTIEDYYKAKFQPSTEAKEELEAVSGLESFGKMRLRLNTLHVLLRDIANSMHEKHYQTGSLEWSTCESSEGIISQISNMLVGLERKEQGEEKSGRVGKNEIERLRAIVKSQSAILDNDRDYEKEIKRLELVVKRQGETIQDKLPRQQDIDEIEKLGHTIMEHEETISDLKEEGFLAEKYTGHLLNENMKAKEHNFKIGSRLVTLEKQVEKITRHLHMPKAK